jgi:hypothetical protein
MADSKTSWLLTILLITRHLEDYLKLFNSL